jgi:hypothetical protein
VGADVCSDRPPGVQHQSRALSFLAPLALSNGSRRSLWLMARSARRGWRSLAAAFLTRSQTKSVSARSLVQDSGAPASFSTVARDPGSQAREAAGSSENGSSLPAEPYALDSCSIGGLVLRMKKANTSVAMLIIAATLKAV